MSAAAEPLALAGRRRATVALMIATAMQAFDATIANVALPRLEQGFGGGIDLGAWVMTSYLCAAAITAILTGWLRRRWGARQVFTAAVTVFVAASLGCALATAFAGLILFRLVQGAAAGIIQPLSQAIVLDLYPKSAHGRMLAIWGATIMAGPMLGPVLGGAITDISSWRWIFAVNAPLGACALMGLRAVPTGAERARAGPIDGVGIALLAIATGALQLALERSVRQLWPPLPEAIGEAGLAIVAAAIIAVRSRRGRSALFRFEVFSDANFALAAFYNFLVGASLFTTIVFLPALGEGPLGWSASQAGLAIAPRGVGTMAMMLAIRHLIDRVDHRALLAVGLLTTSGALFAMARVPAHGAESWIAATSAVQGIGVGLLFTPLSTLAFSTLGAELRADAAGVYNLARQIGCATGVALMTAVLRARIHDRLTALQPPDRHAGAPAPHLAANAALSAYADCLRILAVLTLAMLPGIFLFAAARGREARGLGR